MQTQSEKTLKIAQQAFDYFTNGLENANWQDFIDMLTDNFTFWFPMGKFHGLNTGKEGAKEFFEYLYEAFQPGIKLTSQELNLLLQIALPATRKPLFLNFGMRVTYFENRLIKIGLLLPLMCGMIKFMDMDIENILAVMVNPISFFPYPHY
jgi:hypothetical protein